MQSMENPEFESASEMAETELQKRLTELRGAVHTRMEEEINKRLREDSKPSEEELRMAAFKENLEPQMRDAVLEMNRKGYGTTSSGFYGSRNDFQAIDGYFTVDEETKQKLEAIGVQVLRGPELGIPLNKLITQLRFYPDVADLEKMKEKWDAAVALLPQKEGPTAICDRAEEFRQEYDPRHPSLEAEREAYFKRLREELGVEKE